MHNFNNTVDERLAALRAAIQIGDGQLERGEGALYTPERLELLTAKAFANYRQDKKIAEARRVL